MLAPVPGRRLRRRAGCRNELKLRFDPTDGRLFIDYFDNRFPINPRDYAAVLLTEGGPLETVSTRVRRPADRARRACARAAETKRAPNCAARNTPRAIAEALRAYDAATELGRDHLHRLLDRQNFRLAWWRAASDEINWRRFFDVNGLAGIRVENAGGVRSYAPRHLQAPVPPTA